MTLVPSGTVGGWTPSYLTRFLNDWLRRNPLPAQDQLTIKKLTISGALTTDGNLDLEGRTVLLRHLPTADPHVKGQLWSNAGILTVSAG